MIVASVLLLDERQAFPGLLALPACLGAALLILAGMERRPVITRMLSVRPAVAIGLISYSLYLWHWPLLSFARYHLDRPLQWTELACSLARQPARSFRDLPVRGTAGAPL